MAKRIAIYYDNRTQDQMRTLIRTHLEKADYEVNEFISGQPIYPAMRDASPDIVIIDTSLDTSGLGWQVMELCLLDPELGTKPILIASADLIDKTLATYLSQRNLNLLGKPFDAERLLTKLREIEGDA